MMILVLLFRKERKIIINISLLTGLHDDINSNVEGEKDSDYNFFCRNFISKEL